MDKRVQSFLHNAAQGREYRLGVVFICPTCGAKYGELRDAISCRVGHLKNKVPEPLLQEVIATTERNFSNGVSGDFMCLMSVRTPFGTEFTVTNSTMLLDVLNDNVDWLFPRNFGKLNWNLMQYSATAIYILLSTVAMFLAGMTSKSSILIVVTLLEAVYIGYFYSQRVIGELGDPLPIIPWRVATAGLVLAMISYLVGMGVRFLV